MKTLYTLSNKIQPYAWGSTHGIPDLIGISNIHNTPMAELWMGAHSACPSEVFFETAEDALNLIGLDVLIESNPEKYLGVSSVKQFGLTLPFLFKILSAAHPLSLQVHPTKIQAEEGFKRENVMGIPLSASYRNYKDTNHKPEIMLALTPFTAMCGFRPINETVSLLSRIKNPLLNELSTILEKNQNYEAFFKRIIEATETEKKISILAVKEIASSKQNTLTPQDMKKSESKIFQVVLNLIHEYPTDIGILAPLYLNVLDLEPGEALYLDAGIMHAYIQGTGLELMASSDNVLRGGLTQKYIDTAELLSILNVEPYSPQLITPTNDVGCNTYTTPCLDFELSSITLNNDEIIRNSENPSIILCTEGTITLISNSKETKVLEKGHSVFISAEAKKLQFNGHGNVFMASLPKKSTYN